MKQTPLHTSIEYLHDLAQQGDVPHQADKQTLLVQIEGVVKCVDTTGTHAWIEGREPGKTLHVFDPDRCFREGEVVTLTGTPILEPQIIEKQDVSLEEALWTEIMER
ncbi:MAG: hypothetical protein ABIC95_02425 [archaeon]